MVSLTVYGGLEYEDKGILKEIKASEPAKTETLVLGKDDKIVSAWVDVSDPYAANVTFFIVDNHALTWGMTKPGIKLAPLETTELCEIPVK